MNILGKKMQFNLVTIYKRVKNAKINKNKERHVTMKTKHKTTKFQGDVTLVSGVTSL